MSMIYNYGYKTHDDFNTIAPIIKKHLTTQFIHDLDNHIIKPLINIIDLGEKTIIHNNSSMTTYDHIINTIRNNHKKYCELLPEQKQHITVDNLL